MSTNESSDNSDNILISLDNDTNTNHHDDLTYDLFGDYSSYESLPSMADMGISLPSTISIPSLTTDQLLGLTASSLNTWTLPQNNTGIYTISAGGTGGITTPIGTINGGTGYNSTWSNGYNGIKIQGDAEVDGDLKIKGESISDLLNNIQDKLAIFKPNPELEKKWESLRDLARQYKELEADIKEKELIWETLKK